MFLAALGVAEKSAAKQGRPHQRRFLLLRKRVDDFIRDIQEGG